MRGLGSHVQERKRVLKDCKYIASNEIIVDNVDEVVGVVNFVQDVCGTRVVVVGAAPLGQPQLKRFRLPLKERLGVDDGGLQHLAPGKDAPRHRARRAALGVGDDFAVDVDGLELNRRVPLRSIN